MGDARTGNASCRPDQAYQSFEEAARCRPLVERRSGAPHRIVERADVDIYSGTCYGSWWELQEFEGCYEGAVFDGWFGSNYELASRCAESLNNIGGRGSYVVRLYRENFLFSDYYSVKVDPTE
jgi:hypothetical protein